MLGYLGLLSRYLMFAALQIKFLLVIIYLQDVGHVYWLHSLVYLDEWVARTLAVKIWDTTDDNLVQEQWTVIDLDRTRKETGKIVNVSGICNSEKNNVTARIVLKKHLHCI